MFIATDAICISCHNELYGVILSVQLWIGLAEAQTISPLYSRWAPDGAVSPSPSHAVPALAVYSSTAPDLPRRVGAQATHRRGETIEANQVPR
jgi:hypothetical protein